MVRDRGVEPPSSDWKPDILAIIRIPQNDKVFLILLTILLVGGEGFEPSTSGSKSNLKIAVQLFLQESIILRRSSN